MRALCQGTGFYLVNEYFWRAWQVQKLTYETGSQALKLATASAQSGTSDFPWKAAWREHRIYLSLCVVYAIVGYGMIYHYNRALITTLPWDFWIFLRGSLQMMLGVVALFTLHHLVKVRPVSPIKSTWIRLRERHLANANVPAILFGFLGIALVMPVFVNMKPTIPMINPFVYDSAFEHLDRILHFGNQPWELLEPITNNALVTFILHRNYYFWFPVIFVTFFWQMATPRDPALRMQFIIAFLACWIVIGTVMAIGFSSAGPIFFDRLAVENPDTYARATAFFEEIDKQSPLLMIFIRDSLWEGYQGNVDKAYIRGISAMPSMHVSLAMLLVLFGWKKHWIFGLGYTIFFLMIAIGSVYLLWHYAVDAYVAIIATIPIWWISGILSRSAIISARYRQNPTSSNPSK